MSDSRLEKFIYAICSMDVTDLPVPLSRIEKLWNCLITGETPDFEPLSRNEKYLMAMLDRYDISNLPAPMSRGEKLLYKIAVGETDLSDVPEYLSRYEELLKYLIENGGIRGGDFEYVLHTFNQSLYTLYTTAEKPVKSAILKGQTLVNLFNVDDSLSVEIQYRRWKYQKQVLNLIGGNKYYVYFFNKLNNLPLHIKPINTDGEKGAFNVEANTGKVVTLDSTITNAMGYYYFKDGWTGEESKQDIIDKCKILFIEYREGMENWDIPYFEGMQSVKMPVLTTTGKNLFNVETQSTNITIDLDNGLVNQRTNDRNTSDFINVISGKTYVSNKIMTRVALYNNGSFVRSVINTTSIQINSNENQLRFSYINSLTNIQLEEGSVATSYEHFKSNILTTPQDLELRGIGDVQDELDCLTGEVTEHIGEIVLDGSETWREWSTTETSYGFALWNTLKDFKPRTVPICNALLSYNFNDFSLKDKGVALYTTNTSSYSIFIRLPKTECTGLEDFKTKLQTNPITVQYELANEFIKTVDLTVVDQDNQPTQLGTFENITHVSLESAGLIPEVEMEVATRISKELASASPLMDDISMKQEQLNTTIDEQSNNVDATMIATTEIYEEIL